MNETRQKHAPARRAARAAALPAVLAALLAACGQSGPLYLPDEAPRTVPEPEQPAPPDDEERDDGARR